MEVDTASPADILTVARATVKAVNGYNNWTPSGGFCMVWPQASRLAEDGERGYELLRKYTETAQAITQPNAWVWDGGGGTLCVMIDYKPI